MSKFVVKHAAVGLDPSGVLDQLFGDDVVIEPFDESQSLVDQVAEASVLLTRNVPVTADVISAAPDLKLIQRPGVTVFDDDQPFAANLDIPVCNVPNHLLLESQVGEHAAALMLALLKRIPDGTQVMRERKVVSQPANRLLQGKWLGLVGVGRTGEPIMRVAQALEMKTAAVKREVGDDIRAELGLDWLGDMSQLHDLLAMSDIVSIHVPLAHYRGLFDRAALAAMKPGTWLVNVARAHIVDREALRDALESGHLAGYATDVWWEEPALADDDLVEHPSVLATPHIASAATEGQERMYGIVADNIKRVIAGETPEHRVN